jgi:hypothetical protein
MQIVPLKAAHLFDLNAAILVAAVQPKRQHSIRSTPIFPVCFIYEVIKNVVTRECLTLSPTTLPI